MVRRGKGLFILYLVIGIYLLNMGIGLINLPGSLASILNKWVLIVGGLLIVFAGFKQSGFGRRNYYY